MQNILIWEIGGFLFILTAGSLLHFVFELSNFWMPIASITPVNESTWEHLKMVFWPGLFFFVFEYIHIKSQAKNFWFSKSLCLVIMPLFIAVGWYGMVALIGENLFLTNILLFITAIFVGQSLSYKVITTNRFSVHDHLYPIILIFLLGIAFIYFTYFPPRIFLFEHMDLANTNQYGILKDYDNLRIFTH
jgi:hypothetical protein